MEETVESVYSNYSMFCNDTELYPCFGGNGTNGTGEIFASPLPWWRQMLWSVLFGVMVVVATVGNLVVIWIVLAHKRMRTVTNYLLVNLSIADAMVSTLNVIPNYIFMLSGHWPFGWLYCKIVQFVAVLSICASVFSLMAIAFDRYMAIMYPLKPRMGKRLTLGIAASIWVGGCALSLPMLIFYTTFENPSGDVLCYADWPDGPQTESKHENIYNIFFMGFTYFLPITAMGFTYARVGVELWGSKSIGECTQRQLDNIKSKRRVVKMMIVVVTIFACCWLPFHVYFIVVFCYPTLTNSPAVQEVFLGIYWVAMSNSMYNPIIYCWMNARFRRGFQQAFSWCPFIVYPESEANTTVHMVGPEGGRRDQTTRYTCTGSPDVHTRLARNGSAAVHIPLHVLTKNGNNTSAALSNSHGNASGNGNGIRERESSFTRQNNFPASGFVRPSQPQSHYPHRFHHQCHQAHNNNN